MATSTDDNNALARRRRRKRPRALAPGADPATAAVALQAEVLALIERCRPPQLRRREELLNHHDQLWMAFCRSHQRSRSNVSGDGCKGDLEEAVGRLQRRARALAGSDRTLLGAFVAMVQRTIGGVVAGPMEPSTRRTGALLVQWAWRMHRWGLWRWESWLVALGDGPVERRWLAQAITAMLEKVPTRTTATAAAAATAAEPEAEAPPHLRDDKRFFANEPVVAQEIVMALVRGAFVPSPTAPTTTTTGPNESSSSITGISATSHTNHSDRREAARLALRLLEDLTTTDTPAFAPQALLAVAEAIVRDLGDSSSSSTMRVFLRARIKALLLSSHVSDHIPTSQRLVELLVSCTDTVDVAPFLRQVWCEVTVAALSSETSTSIPTVACNGSNGSSDTSPSPSVTRSPSVALREVLRPILEGDAALRQQGLTIAHDLAHEALGASDPVRLRQSLELAAVVATAATAAPGRTYDAWFRRHFGAGAVDSGTETKDDRGSLDSCLRSPVAECQLLSSHRQLPFLCAFLLEFDRLPDRRAEHVYAHLGAIKSHQTHGGASVAGLLGDFCSQTRARHQRLLAIEHEQTDAAKHPLGSSSSSSLSTSSASSASPARVQTPDDKKYTRGTVGIVQELLATYATDKKLPPQVNQWKMFKPQEWRAQILPCALDLAFWLERVTHDDDGRCRRERACVQTLTGLVQALANNHIIGSAEYEPFLQSVEKWIDEQNELLKSPSHQQQQQKQLQRQRRTSVDIMGDLRHAVENFTYVYGLNSAVSGTGPAVQERTQRAWDEVALAFVAAFEHLTHTPGPARGELLDTISSLVVQQAGEAIINADGPISTTADALGTAVERHLHVWIRLLSSESDDAAADVRMELMSSYCERAVEQLAMSSHSLTTSTSNSSALVGLAALGSLLGLLASLPFCQPMAKRWIAELDQRLFQGDTTSSTRASEGLQLACVFLAGVLCGFITNPAEQPAQVLQSVLTPMLLERIVWLAHHVEVWDLPATGTAWVFVTTTLSERLREHGWLRLVFAPSALTTRPQWQRFFDTEFRRMLQLLQAAITSSGPGLLQIISQELEQIDSVLLMSTQSVRHSTLTRSDVAVWLARVISDCCVGMDPEEDQKDTTLTMALETAMMLLRELGRGDRRWTSSSSIDVLDEVLRLMTTAISRCTSATTTTTSTTRALRIGVGSIRALLQRTTLTDSGIAVSSSLTLFEFLRAIGAALVSQDTYDVISSDGVRLLFELTASLTDVSMDNIGEQIPTALIALWAVAFVRLRKRLTRSNTKTTNAWTRHPIVHVVSSCHELFKAVGATVVVAPTADTSVSMVSNSVMRCQVESLRWLVQWDLLSIRPPTAASDVITPVSTFALHSVASRVNAYLLQSMKIATASPESAALAIASCCQRQWSQSLMPSATSGPGSTMPSSPKVYDFQLILLHMMADLSSQYVAVSRQFSARLTRQKAASSAWADVSTLIFLILSIATETEQLEAILGHSRSQWINNFPVALCALVESQIDDPDSQQQIPRLMVQAFGASQGIRNRAREVLRRVLTFAVSNQIDILDSALPPRLSSVFPELDALVTKVPVLCADSAMFVTGE